jgi:hypothetical protein
MFEMGMGNMKKMKIMKIVRQTSSSATLHSLFIFIPFLFKLQSSDRMSQSEAAGTS